MRWFATLWLLACNGGPDLPTGPLPTTQPGDDDDDDTIGPIRTDEGSVVVAQWLPSAFSPAGETVLAGMFVETRRGVINLAQCVGIAESFCADQYPAAPDNYVPVFELDPLLLGDLYTRNVGDTVTFGPWTADYLLDGGTNLGFYFKTWAGDVTMPTGPLGLSLDGDWGPYVGTDDLIAPTPMVLTSLNAFVTNDFYDSSPIQLRWEPGTEGEVYVVVDTFAELRLYWLEDDGEFDLDLTSMGLGEGGTVDLIVGRWGQSDIDHDGHVANLQVQSNQRVRGIWREIGARTELTGIPDTCAEAFYATPFVPGNYYGDITGYANNLSPSGASCTGFAATGGEGILPIELQAEDLLTISYQLLSNDASVYLVTDCASVNTCFVGEDSTLVGGIEALSWFNGGGAATTVYLVIDAYGAINDIFNLDITIDSLGGDVLVPTCVEAQDQGPIGTGSYHGGIGGNADLLDPACAAPAGGGEGMMQVYLDPGQTLTATGSAPGNNPKLYLLYNCAIADSCFLAAAAGTGSSETLEYNNATGFSEFFYLVVDGELNVDEYFLDITIQ